MAITNTQEGIITEAEFAKVAILTTNGALVPARPLADDERRDFEIHIRKHFRESLAVQVKTSKRLRSHRRSRLLRINFRLKAPLVTNSRLWYFMAHFDVEAMGFTAPVLFVPSRFVHDHARHGFYRREIQFQVEASLEPTARDKWSPYRLPLTELGPRILHILQGLRAQTAPRGQMTGLLDLANLVWVRRQAASAEARRGRAA